ncbi:hypothetical protein BpHYR1_028150 [Brachionus plicatilis]|uniref:Uncharacterized protein n=1 Tax=Brachionus plicatilis TaxID=10195 RepID=A0A3M7PN45_BRAPC|nr:hypothetical protein BpHYR1_028150 [Brachionus plicatilis]
MTARTEKKIIFHSPGQIYRKSIYLAKTSFLRPYRISMILAAKHRKKSHFDSLVLLELFLII